MINIKFAGKRYKIFANGKIKCIDEYSDSDMETLKNIVELIKGSYNNPSDGFLVGYMAGKLQLQGIEVISYRDYEMENANSNTVY